MLTLQFGLKFLDFCKDQIPALSHLFQRVLGIPSKFAPQDRQVSTQPFWQCHLKRF
jgi:hypothetical protein